MSEFLKTNLAVLGDSQPDLAGRLAHTGSSPQALVRPSRNGEPSLRMGKAWLTSTVDPSTEGRNLAADAPEGPLLVLGFGLGYHIESLTNQDILIWEPDPQVLTAALAARELSGLLSRVRIIVDPPRPDDLAGRRTLVHKATARLHPGAEAHLLRMASGAQALERPGSPRVLVVPPIMGGSLPVTYWCAEALVELGCKVSFVPIQAIRPLYEVLLASNAEPSRLARLQKPLVQYLGETVILAAEEFQADLCFVMAQAPLVPHALKGLRQTGVPTAFWFIENYRLFNYFKDVAPFYDFFFHIQGQQMQDRLAALGVEGHFLPVAAHPPRHKPVELTAEDRRDFGATVGFMGSGSYPNRQAIFSRLLDGGLDLCIWGTEWPQNGTLGRAVQLGGRRLNEEEVVKVYNACDVVINLHSALRPDDPVGLSDFANPRTFEIPACGGFQLVDQVLGLESLFEPGKEIIIFENEEDLQEKSVYYVENQEQTAAIAQAGRTRVLAEHTYALRMKKLLDICLGPRANGPGAPARGTGM